MSEEDHRKSKSVNHGYQATTLFHPVSGIAKLGHTGARALTTGGCAPPVQALLKISVPNVNRKLSAKSAQRCGKVR